MSSTTSVVAYEVWGKRCGWEGVFLSRKEAQLYAQCASANDPSDRYLVIEGRKITPSDGSDSKFIEDTICSAWVAGSLD